MEMKAMHVMQGVSIDSGQNAVPQKIQPTVTGSMRQEDADNARKVFDRKTSSDEGQAICSNSAGTGGHASNFQDFQEPGTTWQDDENEYETQMNLLNQEWKRPEVNEVMAKLHKKELSFADAASRISVILGHGVTIASLRNRILDWGDLSNSRLSNNQKQCENDRKTEGNAAEKHPFAAKEFGPGLYEVIRNLRGNLNNIAIKEQHSNCVRIYRRSTTRHYYSYYRCSTCDHLSRREVQDGHPSPIIKMVHDNIVGEPFPSHHPECKPIPLSQLRAMQIDRENRQEVIDEMLTPFEAWSRGHLRALLEEARKASQLARERPQWKKVKCRSRNENERHSYARPYGETLVSYEEKIRKRLSVQLKRPRSRTDSVVSERYGAQTPTDDEWSFARRKEGGCTFMTDESQSLVSDLTEVPDADGLLSVERAHIKQSQIPVESVSELNMPKKSSSVSVDSGKATSDFDGMNQTVLGDQTLTSKETVAEPDVTSASTGIWKVDAGNDCSNRITGSVDDTGRDLIRKTDRKLFMVDDEQLLKLFRRCPNCGEKLKNLALSSQKAIPVVTYKCYGSCNERLWLGHERR